MYPFNRKIEKDQLLYKKEHFQNNTKLLNNAKREKSQVVQVFADIPVLLPNRVFFRKLFETPIKLHNKSEKIFL